VAEGQDVPWLREGLYRGATLIDLSKKQSSQKKVILQYFSLDFVKENGLYTGCREQELKIISIWYWCV
jgi:hypothetical protein